VAKRAECHKGHPELLARLDQAGGLVQGFKGRVLGLDSVDFRDWEMSACSLINLGRLRGRTSVCLAQGCSRAFGETDVFCLSGSSKFIQGANGLL
jgi:hypothetical protein